MKQEHFDAVIVGSGFGGSVMAYRLAEAGLQVCLLERGQAFSPGTFPRNPYDLQKNFWDPSAGLRGMFNVWSFKGLEALVASGLGGGSLIYANVLLRKDEKWFVKEEPGQGYEYWPVTRKELDPHYDRVEEMLNAQAYPFSHEPYNRTWKTAAYKQTCEALGYEWFLPKLAVTFANPGEAPRPGVPLKERHPNLHGAPRSTCVLCAECDFGCNTGSKNTLDLNYLSAARSLGAELRTLSEVQQFSWEDGKYEISYRDLACEPVAMKSLSAANLILAAGTLGTNYLLLKNRHQFPALGSRLGGGFCGNGDLLAFVYKCRESGGTKTPRRLDPSRGTVITSSLRVPDILDGGRVRGQYVQDAGYPYFLNWVMQLVTPVAPLKRALKFAGRYLARVFNCSPDNDLGAELADLVGDGTLARSSMPLLGMGRDIPDGIFTLKKNRLETDWTVRRSRLFFRELIRTMRGLAENLGGRFQISPLSYLGRVITVHPLGGCVMGESPEQGVVNSRGEVFNYPGFYIADGSVMPGPVGPNPSLTIAALADRFADNVIARHKTAVKN